MTHARHVTHLLSIELGGVTIVLLSSQAKISFWHESLRVKKILAQRGKAARSRTVNFFQCSLPVRPIKFLNISLKATYILHMLLTEYACELHPERPVTILSFAS